MEKCLEVAKLLCIMYKEKFGKDIDEMKTHKLMYFAQRESFILFNVPLFNDETFQGWKYGPVLISVRKAFQHDSFKTVSPCSSPQANVVINNILDRFGSLSAWTLSELSHQEISWKLSRIGKEPADSGQDIISNDAIKLDAAREKANRKLVK